MSFFSGTDHTYFKSPMESDYTYCKRYLSDAISTPSKIKKLRDTFNSTYDPNIPSTSQVHTHSDKAYNAVGELTPPSETKTTAHKNKRRIGLTHSILSLTPKCRKLYNKCISKIKRKNYLMEIIKGI